MSAYKLAVEYCTPVTQAVRYYKVFAESPAEAAAQATVLLNRKRAAIVRVLVALA